MKKFVLAFILLISSLSVNAQYFKKYIFHPEWYVSVGTGVNYFVGEGFRNYSMFNALGIMSRVSLGYNITPIIGLRGNVEWNTHNWPTYNNISVIKSFNAKDLTIDAILNLTNWWFGYNKNQAFTCSLYGGAGVGYRDESISLPTTMVTYVLRGGINGSYRINPKVSLLLQAETNLVTDNYNGFILGNPFDMYPAVCIGVNYTFPKNKIVLHSHKYNYEIY